MLTLFCYGVDGQECGFLSKSYDSVDPERIGIHCKKPSKIA